MSEQAAPRPTNLAVELDTQVTHDFPMPTYRTWIKSEDIGRFVKVYGLTGEDSTSLASHIASAVNSYDASRALIEQMRDALKTLAGDFRFRDSEEGVWWCRPCQEEAPIGQEVAHGANCLIGNARAALAAAEKFLKEGR